MIAVRAVLENRRVRILEPEKLSSFGASLPAGTELEATFRKWSDSRSLRANALFHSLVGRYAKANGIAFDQVKIDMKKHYGVWVSLEDALKDMPPWNGRLVDYYGEKVILKSTADYTVREFNELIKGTLAECFDSGVKIDDIMTEGEI